MGKPSGGNAPLTESESNRASSRTRGSETSHYPEEKKTDCDSLSSGERKGKSPNRRTCPPGLRDLDVVLGRIGEADGKRRQRG